MPPTTDLRRVLVIRCHLLYGTISIASGLYSRRRRIIKNKYLFFVFMPVLPGLWEVGIGGVVFCAKTLFFRRYCGKLKREESNTKCVKKTVTFVFAKA